MKFLDLKYNLDRPKPIYFIIGDDRFLLLKAQDIIIHKFITNAVELNLQIFSGEECSMQDLVESAQTFPFASDYRVLLVRSLPDKLNANDQKLFDEYLSQPSKQTIMIFVFDEKTDFYQKNFSKVEVVDCSKLQKPVLTKYVASFLAQKNKRITMDAVDLFLELCDNDLVKIEKECSKLAIAIDEEIINKEHILKFVPKSVDYEIFELSNAIGNKDAVQALSILQYLLNRKVSSQYILGVITSHIRRMFYSSITDDSDYNISKMLNIKEYAVTVTRKSSKNFKKAHLKRAIELCLEYDYAIKAGNIDPEVALYTLILEITK